MHLAVIFLKKDKPLQGLRSPSPLKSVLAKRLMVEIDGFITLQNKMLVAMTEVEFKRIKKIVILEEVKYSSEEEFYKAVIQEVSPDFPVIVLWAEGVIFKHTPMPPDLEEFAKRYADEGVVYWANVLYAKKDEYEEEKEIEMHTIKIIKAPAPALVDAAKALRKRLEEEIR